MPTGYTAPIYEGKEDYGTKDYLEDCVRAFFRVKSTLDLDWHIERLEEAGRELDKIINADGDELYDMYREYKRKKDAFNLEVMLETKARRKRHLAILSELESWEPPTALKELKRFAIDQIMLCKSDWEEFKPDPVMSFEQWLPSRINKLAWDIEYTGREIKRKLELHVRQVERWEAFEEGLNEPIP